LVRKKIDRSNNYNGACTARQTDNTDFCMGTRSLRGFSRGPLIAATRTILPVAINLIKCTKTNLLRMRSDDVWITIEKLAYDKAVKNVIEGPSDELRPHRIKYFNKNLNEYYVTTTAGHTNLSNKTSIKIEVLYTVIDRYLRA